MWVELLWLTVRLVALAAALLLIASEAYAEPTSVPDPKRGFRPVWSKGELRSLFARVKAAVRLPTARARDEVIGAVAGTAYRVERRVSESLESYARRVLRTREPHHPAVKQGQWLSALTRQFYADASERFDRLAKFALSNADRRYLLQMADETGRYAEVIGQSLELIVEGLNGAVERLPAVGGDRPLRWGAAVRVHSGGTITVEKMDRIRFDGHRPPPDRPRTSGGALRALFSAQRQYNVSAEMLGRYDRGWTRNQGHVQVILPAAYPAIYLNEIARAGKEAGMHTVHLMTMSKRGDLRQLRVRLKPNATRQRRRVKRVDVRCADEELAEFCAQRIRKAISQGDVHFQVD